MKRKVLTAIAAASVLLTGATTSISQQVVGSTQLGVTVIELRDVTTGWSAKRQVLGKTVFNDSGDGIARSMTSSWHPTKRSHTRSSAPADSWAWADTMSRYP